MSEIKRDPIVTPFVERNLRLTGSKLPNGRFESFLAVEFKENNDNKITMFAASGVYDESNGRQKSATLNIPAYDFAVIAKHARAISEKPNGFEFNGIKVNGIRKRKPGDDSKGTPMGHDGTVFIGKDQEGVCYIGIMSPAVGKLKFVFRPTNWTSMVNVRTNEPANLSDVSMDYAEAWSDILLPIVTHLLVKHPYDFKANQPPRENSGGWGGNKGNGNNWSGNKRGNEGNWGNNQNNNQSNDWGGGDSSGANAGGFDEDIPM